MENSIVFSSIENIVTSTIYNKQQPTSKSSMENMELSIFEKGKIFHAEEVFGMHGEEVNNRIEGEEEDLWDEEGEERKEDRLSLALVGKVWTNDTIYPNVYITTMKGIWVARYGLEINHVGFLVSIFFIGKTRRRS